MATMSPELDTDSLVEISSKRYNRYNFVRQGNKIAIEVSAFYTERGKEHAEIAGAYDIENPDDAGIIAIGYFGGKPRIEVYGGGMGIKDNNPERPQTMELLRKLAIGPGLDVIKST